MHGASGDCYIDDMMLVQGSVPEAGANLLTNGNFETALSGPWNLSSNMTGSAISTSVRHSGNASLHVVSTSFGDTINQAIWENTAPVVTGGDLHSQFLVLPTGQRTANCSSVSRAVRPIATRFTHCRASSFPLLMPSLLARRMPPIQSSTHPGTLPSALDQ